MKKELLVLFENMIIKNAKRYGMRMIRHTIDDNVVTIYSRENDYHLLYTLRSPIIPEPLNLMWQVSIEENQVLVFTFIDPIWFDNEELFHGVAMIANELHSHSRSHGRFALDTTTGDFMYIISFSEEMIEKMPDYIEDQLFMSQISLWATLHIPLIMYTKGWNYKTSCEYVATLLEQGYVDNSTFGL